MSVDTITESYGRFKYVGRQSQLGMCGVSPPCLQAVMFIRLYALLTKRETVWLCVTLYV